MKFKGKKHGFIKDKGNFITVNEGEKINLPEKFANHPLLEKSKEKAPEMRKKKENPKPIKPATEQKAVPKGIDKNGDGVVSNKEMAKHLKNSKKKKGK